MYTLPSLEHPSHLTLRTLNAIRSFQSSRPLVDRKCDFAVRRGNRTRFAASIALVEFVLRFFWSFQYYTQSRLDVRLRTTGRPNTREEKEHRKPAKKICSKIFEVQFSNPFIIHNWWNPNADQKNIKHFNYWGKLIIDLIFCVQWRGSALVFFSFRLMCWLYLCVECECVCVTVYVLIWIWF